jgi:hypothetical protein
LSEIDVAGERLPLRDGLAQEIETAWDRLAGPGSWWSGAERLAIAAEARHAETCDLCRRRKKALSPYTVDGSHDGLGALPPPAVEAIHRLRTDAGRITEKWVGALSAGEFEEPALDETGYVEIVAVVAIVTALDTFDLALGLPRRALPAPVDGAPTNHRPAGAKKNLAWVATLAPEDVSPEDPNPYPVHGDKNIHRGLSLVPQEVFNFFDLDVELYLKDHEIRDFDHEHRAITHAQIELIAGRTSALNGCFY